MRAPARLRLAVLVTVLALAGVRAATADPRRFAPPPPVVEPSRDAPLPAAPAVRWRDPDEALLEARRDKKPILLDVETGWSAWCTRMQRRTYADAGVRADIARAFVPSRIDAEEDRRRVQYGGREWSHRGFADRLKVSTYPTTVFLAPDGTPITRVPGYVAPARFRTLLRYVAEGHYRTQSWDEFAGPAAASDEDPGGDDSGPEGHGGHGGGGRP
jgi:thioredoxin-related protein